MLVTESRHKTGMKNSFCTKLSVLATPVLKPAGKVPADKDAVQTVDRTPGSEKANLVVNRPAVSWAKIVSG